MSKAILVIDMPKNCFHCKLQDWANCRVVKGCHTGDTRPDWCPLHEVPEKKETICYQGEGWISVEKKTQNKGYNACIDEIMKGSE